MYISIPSGKRFCGIKHDNYLSYILLQIRVLSETRKQKGPVESHDSAELLSFVQAVISVPPSSVNTIVLSLPTVTYSTRLPQSASSNSDTASGSFFSSSINRSNSRLRMPRCLMSVSFFAIALKENQKYSSTPSPTTLHIACNFVLPERRLSTMLKMKPP